MGFQSQTNYLSAKVTAVFDNDGVLGMLGGPNTGTSYSLPGHIIISLPTLPVSLQGRLREVKDLKIVMEGKSEFWDDHGRYTPVRLHTTTLTLATPSKPLLIPPQDPLKPFADKIQLAVEFDMRLPGWLPPSHDSDMTTLSYGVVTIAIVGWTEATTCSYSTPSTSTLSSFDSDIIMERSTSVRPANIKPKSSKSFESIFGNHSLLSKSTERSSSQWTPFTIQRHRLPSAIGSFAQDRTERHYTLRPEADSTSPVECVVTVPDWVDVNGEEKSLKVSLRLRARKTAIKARTIEAETSSIEAETSSIEAAGSSLRTSQDNPALTEGGSRELESVPMERQCARGKKADDDLLTHILELGMEVEETERYSSAPTLSFTSSFPLPAEQPTRHSSQHHLISPRSNYADGGFLGYDDRPFRGMRSRPCLLADDGNQRNFFFADQGLGLGEKWRKVNVVLPMPADTGKGRITRPQPEMDGPFLRIRHDLKIRVVCRNANGGGDTQVVILSTPIKFGTCPLTMPSATPRRAPALPAYIQLFHENGELRECDPLPIYITQDSPTSPPTSPIIQIRSIPDTPVPSYESLYPATNPKGCASRSPSPSTSYDAAIMSSSLGRRERSSSPSPSSIGEPEAMNVDGVISSDDESRVSGQTGRKVARTIPSIIRTAA
ncbi:uncharacterized protein IL334_002721 [Kwoniella shivajii]|uniref:Arrestin-like N-terminal domain-containing protein n=1 Tax=Kwoniella shivajii TaxID=564305 RepID=A0ABZ1CZP3_9TREE|nr:hypothetical protein IL334_002721 [Kwoniella shivajii]